MTTIVVIEAVAIALLALLVVGLLRSHAEILRRLHELGAGIDSDPAAGDGGRPDLVPVGVNRRRPARVAATRAFDVVGSTLSGDSVKVGVVGARHGTLLAFLSSGCLSCGNFWADLAAGPVPVPAGARLVVVTKGPDDESESRIRELAPADAPVVMSSPAWHDYGVPGAPFFAYVDGPSGRVVGQGSAQSWDQVATLWARAAADDAQALRRRGEAVDDPTGEARADLDLLQAGIGPGHPSLYPRGAGDGPEMEH